MKEENAHIKWNENENNLVFRYVCYHNRFWVVETFIAS